VTLDELKRFCGDEDDPRHYLRAPFSRGDWTYATNGHICVRTNRIDGVGEIDTKSLLGLEKLFHASESPWIPVPECSAPPDEDCLICNGTGEHECSCGHKHECPDCKGNGKMKDWSHVVQIGIAYFSPHYLVLVQGWEISVSGKMTAAMLRLGDDQGVLMPRRKK
jgi:hypothetical protein